MVQRLLLADHPSMIVAATLPAEADLRATRFGRRFMRHRPHLSPNVLISISQ